MEGWKDKRMDGGMDGWMDGWMDGSMDVVYVVYVCVFTGYVHAQVYVIVLCVDVYLHIQTEIGVGLGYCGIVLYTYRHFAAS